MRFFYHIFCIVIAVSLISAGFPTFSEQDLDRDGRVSLRDVVLSLQSLAEDRTALQNSLPKAVKTFRSVARLKTVIETEQTCKQINSPDGYYLLPGGQPISFVSTTERIGSDDFRFSSLIYQPPLKPPKECS